jgi:protoheme IX farnesyltransferase
MESIAIKSEQKSLRRFCYLVLATSIMTFLLIVMGGIVRVTESGLGCPDWPLCYGRILPPLRADAIIEYTHRLVASLTTPLILASAVVAWWKGRSIRLVFRPMMIALGLLVVEIGLGAVTVLTQTPPVIVAVHLGVALTVLAMLLTATVTAFQQYHRGSAVEKLTYRGRFAGLTVWMLVVLFIVLLSGVFVAGSEATKACTGWPLCNGQLFPSDPLGWIHMTHRFIVAAAGALMIVLFVQAWRMQRANTALFPAAVVTTVLFFAQAYVGALKTTHGFPPFLLALHVATAAATWAGMVVLVVLAGSESQSAEADQVQARPNSVGQYLRDLLTLTRPLVVLLLVVTAFAAMVIGARAWPSPWLAVWTLLGGGLAAGGAQAVNQYVDRDIDRLMARTARRPIPAGRLTPAEGLAWGLSLCIISIYLLAGLVNWLAALLTLVGIIYYVLIYTLMLKRTSVQNIVIGGGAGAMAPVVGLVAVTGRLDLWALFLFAIVFFWTPPHFWALALVRLKDYTAAKIPVMPVARGVDYTRLQIMIYSIALLVVTLLPAVFGITGIVYLVSALLLGGVLLYVSWLVWRKGANKFAWRLYRVSSLYLAFLFFAMMVDSLLKRV